MAYMLIEAYVFYLLMSSYINEDFFIYFNIVFKNMYNYSNLPLQFSENKSLMVLKSNKQIDRASEELANNKTVEPNLNAQPFSKLLTKSCKIKSKEKESKCKRRLTQKISEEEHTALRKNFDLKDVKARRVEKSESYNLLLGSSTFYHDLYHKYQTLNKREIKQSKNNVTKQLENIPKKRSEYVINKKRIGDFLLDIGDSSPLKLRKSTQNICSKNIGLKLIADVLPSGEFENKTFMAATQLNESPKNYKKQATSINRLKIDLPVIEKDKSPTKQKSQKLGLNDPQNFAEVPEIKNQRRKGVFKKKASFKSALDKFDDEMDIQINISTNANYSEKPNVTIKKRGFFFCCF